MQNPFKRSIAIKFKSESYMVLSLSFFIVILVKKKKSQAEKKTVTLSKPCCIRNLSICIWIMNTLKKCFKYAPLLISETYFCCTAPVSHFSAPIYFLLLPNSAYLFFCARILNHLSMAHMHTSYLRLYFCLSPSFLLPASSVWGKCITPFWLFQTAFRRRVMSAPCWD